MIGDSTLLLIDPAPVAGQMHLLVTCTGRQAPVVTVLAGACRLADCAVRLAIRVEAPILWVHVLRDISVYDRLLYLVASGHLPGCTVVPYTLARLRQRHGRRLEVDRVLLRMDATLRRVRRELRALEAGCGE